MFRALLLNAMQPFFVAAMVFALVANGLAFLILARMHSLGHRVGIWRSHKDWALYRDYWRVAPQKRWSRAPVAVGVLSFALAIWFAWLSIKGVHLN
jgi:hypothetical protein